MRKTNMPFAALIISLFMVSCDDELETVNAPGTGGTPGTVQFENAELNSVENAEKTQIRILLTKSASNDGEIVVQINSANISNFQFEPAAIDGILKLPLTKGQSIVLFNVIPLDNNLLDGDKSLEFAIVSTTGGFDIGTKKNLSTLWYDDETPAKAYFDLDHSFIRENNGAGTLVTIALSHEAFAEGVIRLSFQSIDAEYGTHFTTEPAASNGTITLPVEKGKKQIEFKVFPMNDQLFNAGRSIKYSIVDAQGGVEKGETFEHELKIGDDELEGTGKGYEIIAGNWQYKKRYEYNENGTLARVYWDQHTPGHSGGVYNYMYNQAGQLEKIVRSTAREEIYSREGDRIVRSDEFTNSILTKYTLYGYDAAGNVAEAAVHYRQPDGNLKLATLFVYLYHFDSNLYKVLSYSVSEGSDEHTLISTKTFDNYLGVENPFPMVEVLPDYKSQQKLPASYRIEENGHDITYQFTYTFSATGKPTSRTATSSSGSETARYEYYE